MMTFLLDDQLSTQVYIPRGFLHGYQALTAVTDFVYRMDAFYGPGEDVTVKHDDPGAGCTLAGPHHDHEQAGPRRAAIFLGGTTRKSARA